MVLWTDDGSTIEERVAAIIRSGIFPVLAVQDNISEECSRG